MRVFKEFWRTVVIDGVEYPKYAVSNFGRVKNLDYRGTGRERLFKLSIARDNYLRVMMINKKNYSVHRLVAEVFIPNPEEKPYIDHINTVRTDNIVLLDDDGKTVLYTNLRWVTTKENCNNTLSKINMRRNAKKPCLGKFGAEHPNAKEIVQFTYDGQFISKWSCAKEAGRELEIERRNITNCCLGKRKSAGGYKWKYASDCRQRKSVEDIKPLF